MMVLCKCPKCGLIYRKRLYWTGRGHPKIYCKNCSRLLQTMEGYLMEGSGLKVWLPSLPETEQEEFER